MTPEQKVIAKRVILGIIALLALMIFFATFTIVGAGERGVVVRLGAVQDRILNEGFSFKKPFVEDIVHMDVTVQKIEVQAQAASKDLQTVTAKIALNYHLQPDRVNKVYQELRDDYEVSLIHPAIEEMVKAGTAKFTAEELITQRENIKEEILAGLRARLTPYGFVVDQLSIVNFDFSASFNAAIEAKVTAEQNALAAKNKLAQVEYEKDQRIAQAQGEAEAIRIQAGAIAAQGGANYVQLKSVEKWNGTLPTYMMGDSVPFINITQ